MNLTDSERLRITTSDVVTFQRCEWAWVNTVAVACDGAYPAPRIDNPMRELMGEVAVEHRQRVERFAARSAHATPMNREAPLSEQWGSTTNLIDAVWEWSDRYSPFDIEAHADLLLQEDGQALITMTKLGNSSMRALRMRSAGGFDGLTQLRIDALPELSVAFADGTLERDSLVDMREQWRETLGEMTKTLENYLAGAPLDWWETPFDQCGRLTCEWCQDALSRNNDLFHIARIRRTHRRELRRHGIHTMSDFVAETPAELAERVASISRDDIDRLHTQASVQTLSQKKSGPPAVKIIDPAELASLPPVRSGNLYLDFESDPSYTEWVQGASFEPGASGPRTWIGLEYLIGVLESGSEEYRSWWSDSFADEGEAFAAFIDELISRHQADRDFRVFHYAPYEIQALNRLSERHGYGHDHVTELIESGVMVDLYKVVMNSVAVGSPSYSLKKLEELYFTGTERAGITQGVDSVKAFSRYRHDPQQSGLKSDILSYNHVDCLSTKRLHQWLVDVRAR